MYQVLLSLLPLLATLTPTLAAPISTCGQYTTVQAGPFTVNPNQWGKDQGSGFQCAQIDGLHGNSLAWSTKWAWANNPNNVKSYANALSSSTPCKPLNGYKSIPSTWDWSYSGNPARADVAYDAFLGATCGDNPPHDVELMVWLAAMGGVNPISDTGKPIATPTIGGIAFDLHFGFSKDANSVTYSFVAQKTINSYKGDLMDFFNYLTKNHPDHVSGSQFLQTLQAGTEPFEGSDAVFKTSSYTISSS